MLNTVLGQMLEELKTGIFTEGLEPAPEWIGTLMKSGTPKQLGEFLSKALDQGTEAGYGEGMKRAIKKITDHLGILNDIDFLDVLADPRIAEVAGVTKSESGETEVESIVAPPLLRGGETRGPGLSEMLGQQRPAVEDIFGQARGVRKTTVEASAQAMVLIATPDGKPTLSVLASNHPSFQAGAVVTGDLLGILAASGIIAITILPRRTV